MHESIFRAYDIRGVYPSELNEQDAYRIGLAFVQVIKPKTVVMGKDVRVSGPQLFRAFAQALHESGVQCIDIGTVTTEMMYYALGSGNYDAGVIVSASHNPAQWNGFKMATKGVVPISETHGIPEIKQAALAQNAIYTPKENSIKTLDVANGYFDYCMGWIDATKLKPLKIVANANFGMAGVMFEKLVARHKLPFEIIKLNCEPDGTFSKGRPDPFTPENRVEIAKLVKDQKADLGVAWDADADRVFFVDGTGTFLDAYYTSAALIGYILDKNPGAVIGYDIRYTMALLDAIESHGGKPILTRVGHTFIKEKMRQEHGLFGAESSGHYFHKDFWCADSGMVTFLLVAEMVSTQGPLSELVAPYTSRFFISGEMNSDVADKRAKMDEIEKKYAAFSISKIDGVTIEGDGWRANIRPSNTEDLLRLNVEATNQALMEQKRDEFLALIRN